MSNEPDRKRHSGQFFHSKYNLDVDLGVGIRHAPTISLLTELRNSFLDARVLQRFRPLTGLNDTVPVGVGHPVLTP